MEEIATPTISVIEVNSIEVTNLDWVIDLKSYFETGKLPNEPSQARKVKLWAPWFHFIDGKVYKRSYRGILLRYLSNLKVRMVIEELHNGIFLMHQDLRTLAK